jgi:phosphatidylglycerophosphatase A
LRAPRALRLKSNKKLCASAPPWFKVFHMKQKPSLKSPAILLATWFGSGYITPAPGTWGTLAALPFGIAIMALAGPLALAAASVLIFIIGLWAAKKFDAAAGTHDSKHIVIDEVTGQWIAMIPAGLNPLWIGVSFILFRGFDIVKPWPISYADKHINGPLGVMIDDILAGIAALLCLIGLQYAAGSY